MRRLFQLLALVLVSGLVIYGSVAGGNAPVTLTSGVAEAQAAGKCGLSQPVFCETFDSPSPVNSRAGQLDSVLWGASRIEGAIALGSNLFNSASNSTMTACGSSYTAQPGTTDIIICNGQLRESSYDEHGVSTLAIYPKQPFDWGGRTGTVTFDVSNDTSGSHGTWPEFWITDQPVPAPFTHGGDGGSNCDLCSLPRNGIGIDLSGGIAAGQAGPGSCGVDNTRRWTVSQIKVVRNYVEQDVALYSDPNLQGLGCVRQSSGPNDALNHVEVRISQNQIDVWATDPGSSSLKHITAFTNANLPMNRGVIWLEDSHYNASKVADPGTGTPDLSNHTFTWDNVGFDGPATYRDISLDVLDALQPTNLNTDAAGVTGKLLNLGWGTTPSNPVNLNTVSGFTQAHINTATGANKGALLMFNMGDANNGQGITTINYTINGHAHSSGLPFSTVGRAYHSIALPVPFSDVVVGAQNIKLSANVQMMVTNVNLVLLAGALVPGSSSIIGPEATLSPISSLTFTPTPTKTPSSSQATATATPTRSPTPTAVPQQQSHSGGGGSSSGGGSSKGGGSSSGGSSSGGGGSSSSASSGGGSSGGGGVSSSGGGGSAGGGGTVSGGGGAVSSGGGGSAPSFVANVVAQATPVPTPVVPTPTVPAVAPPTPTPSASPTVQPLWPVLAHIDPAQGGVLTSADGAFKIWVPMAAERTDGPLTLSLAPTEMSVAHNLEVNGVAYTLVVLDTAGTPLVTFDPPFEVVMPLPVGVDPSLFSVWVIDPSSGEFVTLELMINGEGTVSTTVAGVAAPAAANAELPAVDVEVPAEAELPAAVDQEVPAAEAELPEATDATAAQAEP